MRTDLGENILGDGLIEIEKGDGVTASGRHAAFTAPGDDLFSDAARPWNADDEATADGAAIERFGVQEIEPRMVVLARLLKHRDYDLRLANLWYGIDLMAALLTME